MRFSALYFTALYCTALQAVYQQYFGEPNSHKSHELLHTHYHEKSGEVRWGEEDLRVGGGCTSLCLFVRGEGVQ
jgi:hypothetical protein